LFAFFLGRKKDRDKSVVVRAFFWVKIENTRDDLWFLRVGWTLFFFDNSKTMMMMMMETIHPIEW